MWFTSVNFYVAKGKNTTVLQNKHHARSYITDYDNSPIIKASKIVSQQVLGGF